MSPLIRLSCSPRSGVGEVAYVSFDRGRTWWAVHPDGTTQLQFRTPLPPLVFRHCWCDRES